MSSFDVALTFGADVGELEKAMQNAGQNISKNLEKGTRKGAGKPPPLPRQVSTAEKAFTSFQGGGLIGLAGMALGLPSMITDAIGALVDGVKKLMDEARRLRNLSYETGLSTQELQRIQVVAESAGLSLESVAHGMAEFNKKMGQAKIQGSEVNAVMAKLGVGLNDINKGNFKFFDAIRALNGSFKAGTDEATLMHYAVQLFGSSAEQLMPIIKGSVVNMEVLKNTTLTNTQTSINSMNQLSDAWTRMWANMKVAMFEAAGYVSAVLFGIKGQAVSLAARVMAMSNPKAAARLLLANTEGMTDEQRAFFAGKTALGMSRENQKSFLEEISKTLGGGGGTKLSPLGLSEAQGASRVQQMGGGDIVSAIAFTPLDRIATATEQTSQNTSMGNQIMSEIVKGTIKATTGGVLSF